MKLTHKDNTNAYSFTVTADNRLSFDDLYFVDNDLSTNLSSVSGSDLIEDITEKIFKQLSAKPIIEHKCHNCGATVELEENKHIFICRYCGSVYSIGTSMINDVGD